MININVFNKFSKSIKVYKTLFSETKTDLVIKNLRVLTRRVSNSTANKNLASSCYFTPDDVSVSDYSSAPLVFTTDTPDCLEKFSRTSLADPKTGGKLKLTIFSESKEVN